MKSIANRIIVFAVSALAFGTAAFSQTRITAEVPFAFRTVMGTLPAGNYEITQLPSAGIQHMVSLVNTASSKGVIAGQPIFDAYHTVGSRGPSVDFACVNGECSLKAIHTIGGTLVYATPGKSKRSDRIAVISIPLKVSNAD